MIDTDYIPLDVSVQQVITADQAWHYHIVPKSLEEDTLTFYSGDPESAELFVGELEILFGKSIVFEGVQQDILAKTLGKYYRRTQSNTRAASVSGVKAEDFLSRLISEAKELGSSDIHIEVYDEKARVRIRIDGVLVERYTLQKSEYPALINKVKIKANLDISEKRLPQDGRIQTTALGKKLDIRVSILPTLHGEKIVMRLLSNDATNIDIHTLGMAEAEVDRYKSGIRKPNGIVLISGPTGSGKTTTLYATLKILNEEKRNITTVEDPIEYTLDGINQVQLKESIGLTFASALRTFLRQDPDIIMLGEIRDAETAEMAIRAALTGHLVLSTIHTNSAWGTVDRLVDMGVPPFLLSGTLNTTVAQRLLRLLCPACKHEAEFDIADYPPNFKPPIKVTRHFKAVGCQECFFTGYKGRRAIYEVIPIDYELSQIIRKGVENVKEQLEERQITSLAANAFRLFVSGETCIEEVWPLLVDDY